MLHLTVTCIVLASFTNALDLKFKYTTTKNGYIFPNRPTLAKTVNFIMEGEDVIFQLAKVPVGIDKCLLTNSDLSSTYTLRPNVNNGRVIYWDPNSRLDACGARIKNVSVEDSGRWKLRALNSHTNISYHSFLHLNITKKVIAENNEFDIREGLPANLILNEQANYCEISNPLLDSRHGMFDKCQVMLAGARKMHAGVWRENIGLYGKIEEITLESNVTVIGEYFDVGYNFTGKKINMYCSLRHPVEYTTFTFCRFIKQGNSSGLRMYDGLSNGAYSYYGIGLHAGDCGMTIEAPSEADFTYWRCSLGFYRDTNKKFEVKESYISLFKERRDAAERGSSENKEILAAIGYPLTVSCNSDLPLQYCIITHPNTTFYSLNEHVRNDYWKGLDLDLGVCGVTIFNTTAKESGTWKCQMNTGQKNQLDVIAKVQVRVGETALIATKTQLITSVGAELTIKCQTVSIDKYLKYCRFTMPDGNGFRVSEDPKSSINDLYRYKGTSLAAGDCQITIAKVDIKHIGRWMCAGKVRNSTELESYDFIKVNATDDSLSAASLSGIIIGPAAFLIIILTAIMYRKRQRKTKNQTENNNVSARTSASSEVSIFERAADDNIDRNIDHPQPCTTEDIEMNELHVVTSDTPSVNAETSNTVL